MMDGTNFSNILACAVIFLLAGETVVALNQIYVLRANIAAFWDDQPVEQPPFIDLARYHTLFRGYFSVPGVILEVLVIIMPASGNAGQWQPLVLAGSMALAWYGRHIARVHAVGCAVALDVVSHLSDMMARRHDEEQS